MVGLAACLLAAQLADRLGEPGVLGGQDKIGSAVARPADQIRDDAYIRVVIPGRGELNAGNGEGAAHDLLPSLASSSPARSRATSSSDPPICSPLMKICGTVVRPPARRII